MFLIYIYKNVKPITNNELRSITKGRNKDDYKNNLKNNRKIYLLNCKDLKHLKPLYITLPGSVLSARTKKL